MTQTLNVEYEELLTRATELEQPLPTVPSTNPQGPCNLSFINDTAARLALTADTLRMYLKGCHREWKILATSLRNAAKAYEEVDASAAEDIDKIMNDHSGSGAAAPSLVADEDPWTAPGPVAAAPPFEYPYYEVRQAAADIESGDQGAAFRAFAREWDRFQKAFQEQTYRFRLFTRWEGEATAQVEQNFHQQKEYIYSLAKLCSELGRQADRVVDVHQKAAATTGYNNQHALGNAHPTSYEVSQCDYWYKRYMEYNNQYYVSLAIEWYEKLQANSESALKYYVQYANIPLKPLNPDPPPKATVIKPPEPAKPNPEPEPTPEPDPTPTPEPTPSPTPTPGGQTPTPGQTPAQIGQNLAQGMQGFSQGMQGVTQGMQSLQGLAQGGMGGGSAPAQLASDTAPADDANTDDKDKDKDDEKKKEEEEARLAEGAAPGDKTSGSAPTEPPAAGQSGAMPSGVVL